MIRLNLIEGIGDAISIFSHCIETGGFIHAANELGQIFQRYTLEHDWRCDLARAAL